ncbi:MAG: acyltransferase [Phycisphaeraceae bacterium]|nr:acyltransferase [Phycisphaeraceae bacterium]
MLKPMGQLAGALRALPWRIRYAMLRRVLEGDRALSLTSETAGRATGLLGLYARQAFYTRVLEISGSDVHFGYQTLLSKYDAKIGDRVYLGRSCTVGRVTIGDDTRIADGVQLLSGRHHHGTSNDGVAPTTVSHDRITIGQGVWIGANAVVMADVGDGAIVGAGAVVTKPIAPGQTVVGIPAKPIAKQAQPRQAA